MDNLTPDQCPKFQQCNAPICPLDAEWQKRKHISHERICFYLIETQKANAIANFEVRGLGYLYQAIVRHTSDIADTHSSIKKAMDKAKTTSSRMARKIGERHEK